MSLYPDPARKAHGRRDVQEDTIGAISDAIWEGGREGGKEEESVWVWNL